MIKCPLCKKEFNNISYHFSMTHDKDYVEYLIENKLIKIPKCRVCKNDINVLKGRGRNLILKSPEKLIYCSNKCKFSDDKYNKSRSPRIKNDKNKKVKCSLCERESKDINNLGGHLRIHLRKTHNLEYDKKYFIEHDDIKKHWKCPCCIWKTVDFENVSGAITNHLSNKHNMTILELCEKYPDKAVNNKAIDRNKLIKKSNIKCKICGRKFLIISNTHLKNKHNITQEEYKKKYGNNIISNYMKKELKKCGGVKDAKFISKLENDIKSFIKSLGVEVIQTYRKLGVEYDLYIPHKNILIEVNGLYWHSELAGGKSKNYHIDKTEIAEKNGLQLIHIFEDEWLNKQEIVKSRLRHILGVSDGTIYARKCIIEEIDSKTSSKFLEKYHIQGTDKSKIKLGLFYDNSLVAVMTFGSRRIALGKKKSEVGEFELIRYATSQNVIGGAGKLLSYFVKNFHPIKIISYADRRWSIGNLYEKLGFNLIGKTKPNYFYMENYGKRLHRFNFTKQRILEKFNGDASLTEWKNMQLLCYDRIWDCGSLKYEWKKEQ